MITISNLMATGHVHSINIHMSYSIDVALSRQTEDGTRGGQSPTIDSIGPVVG
jgi:hypothetical protein